MSKKFIGSFLSFSRNDVIQTRNEIIKTTSDAVEIFLKPTLAGKVSPYSEETVNQFKELIKPLISDFKYILPHCGYTINLATDEPKKLERSKLAFETELKLATQLGIPHVVFHPGTVKDKNRERGIKQIAKILNEFTVMYPTVMPLMETMGGNPEGTVLGSTFEQLADIIKLIDNKDNIGVCIDTCHLFVSGYDISTKDKFAKVMNQFTKIIGLRYLKGVHLNGSRSPFKSYHDVHAAIQSPDNHIPLEAFEWLMNSPIFDNIPITTETHIETLSGVKREIEFIRNLQSRHQ